ncbi:MAG: hypothetical protein IJJ13_00855 [Lachnospiraceae bacterium]|nr:hypothetical protein [Lachnospiraceae bacterium]
MKTTKIPYFRIITALLASLWLFSACAQTGNAVAQGGETGAEIGAGEADQGVIPVTVEKVAPDIVTVSFTEEILNTMGDQNEIRIRFYYDDDRNGGFELSSSPEFWVVTTIGEAGPNLAEGSDFQKNGATWKWEIPSPDW